MPAAKSKTGNWRPTHNPWLIAVSVMIATFMEVMDTSIASVAVPYIAGSVSATNNEAEWTLTVYLVANAVFLPSSAWFSERFGRKCFFMVSIAVFTAASFAVGIANSLGLVLLARAIQGAGGGALQPLSQAILMESFPLQKRGQALAVFAIGVVVAPVVGPTLGGWLTDTISWRWAFYINVPIGILAIFLLSRFLEDPPYIRNAKPGRLDIFGFSLLAIWSACLEFIADKGQEDDWFGSSLIRWAAVLLVIAFAAFLIRELTNRKPLVNVRALCNRNLALGSTLVFVLGGAIYAITTILPLFFQTTMEYNATHAGLSVSPRGLGSMVAAMIVGAISAKVDSRILVALGFSILAAASLWTSFITIEIGPWSLFWPITVSGAAIAMTFVPLSNVTMGTLAQEDIGNASGIFNLLRNIGGSVGISAANTISQRHLQSHRAEIVRHINAASPAMREFAAKLTPLMNEHAGPRKAALRVLALTQSQLDRQAQLWAYVDVFRYLAVAIAVCVPLAFFLQKPKTGGRGAA
ncbi:MAG TPA: DHA2 family efflux MFS transporter permease subunit [Bryobacteraceae bacterium]|nr:DHA2 family efflux MFS transporter permease subunit [Bryobacteraceae bacterium]